MKIAIYSDVHDHHPNLQVLLDKLKSEDIEVALCLGDFVSRPILTRIIQAGIKTYAIYGNNEGEKHGMALFAHEYKDQFTLFNNTYGTVELGGKRIFMTHYPDIVESMARSGDFDAVFYGHDHKKALREIDDCIVCNPGEVCGYLEGISTYAIYDTETNQVEILEI